MTEDTIVRNVAEVYKRFTLILFLKIIFNKGQACPAGMTGNGKFCENTDHCKIANGGCSTTPMVKCSNTASGPKCGACPSGFTKILFSFNNLFSKFQKINFKVMRVTAAGAEKQESAITIMVVVLHSLLVQKGALA